MITLVLATKDQREIGRLPLEEVTLVPAGGEATKRPALAEQMTSLCRHITEVLELEGLQSGQSAQVLQRIVANALLSASPDGEVQIPLLVVEPATAPAAPGPASGEPIGWDDLFDTGGLNDVAEPGPPDNAGDAKPDGRSI